MIAIGRTLVVVATAGCIGTAFGEPRSSPSDGGSGTYYPLCRTVTENGPTLQPGCNLPPFYATAPADPWVAVVGDQPKRMSALAAYRWRAREDEFACTAAHDHCLPADTWFFEWDDHRENTNRYAYVYGFMEPIKEADPYNPVAFRSESFLVLPGNLRAPPARSNTHELAFTAYRTVPAAKKNLIPGALVMVMSFPAKHPDAGIEAFRISWLTGIVDHVDRDLGFVFLVGRTDPLWISAARVPVLSWRPGGKVTIISGAKRDQLAVSVSEVSLP